MDVFVGRCPSVGTNKEDGIVHVCVPVQQILNGDASGGGKMQLPVLLPFGLSRRTSGPQ
jgi:hypothetical protein